MGYGRGSTLEHIDVENLWDEAWCTDRIAKTKCQDTLGSPPLPNSDAVDPAQTAGNLTTPPVVFTRITPRAVSVPPSVYQPDRRYRDCPYHV